MTVALYVNEGGGASVGTSWSVTTERKPELIERQVIYSDYKPAITALSCTSDGFDPPTSVGLIHLEDRDISWNRRHFSRLSGLPGVGDRETHPLMGLLDVVTSFVHDYVERSVEIPDAAPAVVFEFLMQQNNLRQRHLAEDFDSQSNVSEVLSSMREINARQARALAKRFRVSPAVFI